jgi:hypothetical protein
MKKFKTIWVTDVVFILMTIASFTSILIPEGEINPKLAGIPYTVWVGVVYCILYVLLAYIASKFQKEETNDH